MSVGAIRAPVLTPDRPVAFGRWWQLVAAIIGMMAIANLQYAWTLFTTPLTKDLGATLAAVQVAFAAFVLCETWLVPFEGALVDRFGHRAINLVGGLLVGVSWIGAGLSHSLLGLYVFYAIGGVGAGAVYGSSVGHALKWFPDHRGLCAGLVAGAYGIGTAITVIPIASMINSVGYAQTFVTWGFIQGIVVAITALFLVSPPKGWSPPGWVQAQAARPKRVTMSETESTPLQMLRQPCFWVLYGMMVLMAFTGLVVTAQLKPIAGTYGVDKTVVAFGLTALVLALQIDRILNGVTRPFWGWVSDHVGRENTMFVAFGLQALTILALLQLVSHPIWFIVLSGLAFFSWGEIFSLFPSAVTDLFGRKFATTNYGLIYTAKGVASIFAGPFAALVMSMTGSWIPVFWAMVLCSAVDALLALFVLKPIARRTAERARQAVMAPGGAVAAVAGGSD